MKRLLPVVLALAILPFAPVAHTTHRALPATDACTGNSAVSGNWTNSNNVFGGTIVYLADQCVGSLDDAFYTWNADSFADDQYAQIKWIDAAVGVLLRSSGNTGYFFQIISAGGTVRLYKYSGASETQIPACTTTVSLTTGDTIKFRVEGTTFTISTPGGGDLGSCTDGTYSSGSPGMYTS